MLLGLSLFCARAEALSKKKPPEKYKFDRQVRIWLGTQDSILIQSSGEIVIECYRNGERAEIYYTSADIRLLARKGKLAVEDDNSKLAIGLSSVTFRPRFPNVFLNYDGKRYRGFIECSIDPENGNKARVFNLVDIELYLKGVLPGEIGDRAQNEFEAVKAQAIAARTYAIWRLSSRPFDTHLKNSIDDQLYLGAGAELSLLNQAVEETEGLIMTVDKKPIAAYYHAVCGGSTAPIEKIWPGEKMSYLKGTVDGDYCQWAKTYYWTEKISAADLSENLSRYLGKAGQLPGKGFGKLLSIKFKKDTSIGRMSEMHIETTTGQFTVLADQIRWALKRPSVPGAILPSTRFDARVIQANGSIAALELVGAGNGHGVGMCQCGAIGRARAGAKFEDILKTYYNNITIEKIY